MSRFNSTSPDTGQSAGPITGTRSGRAQNKATEIAIVWFEMRCDADQRYHFIEVSDSAQQLFGIPASQLLSDAQSFWDLIHPDDLAQLKQRLLRSAQRSAHCNYQFRMTKGTGCLWISLAARARPEADGSVLWYGQLHDQTAFHEATRDLQAAQVQQRLIRDSGRLGLFDFDANSVDDPVSQACLPLLGYRRSDFTGVANSRRFFWRKCIHPGDLIKLQYSFLFQFPMQDSQADRQIHDYQLPFRLRNKAGEWRRFRATAKVVEWDRFGRPYRVVGHYLDLGSSQAHTDTGVAVEKLKTGQAISIVSHELRTPLTAIRGSLGLLEAGKAGELTDTALKMVRIAHNNSIRLIGLVNDILDLDKLSSGHMLLRSEAIDLTDLLREAIDANQTYAAAYRVSLVARLQVSPATCDGNYDRLMQVMNNLISNAVKFSPEGGQVLINLTDIGSSYRIAVSDDGPGIPPEFQTRLFDHFAQADLPPGSRRQGSGLGLPITKALVEAMGGQIFFTTEAGRGSTFWFELPRDAASASD